MNKEKRENWVFTIKENGKGTKERKNKIYKENADKSTWI